MLTTTTVFPFNQPGVKITAEYGPLHGGHIAASVSHEGTDLRIYLTRQQAVDLANALLAADQEAGVNDK